MKESPEFEILKEDCLKDMMDESLSHNERLKAMCKLFSGAIEDCQSNPDLKEKFKQDNERLKKINVEMFGKESLLGKKDGI